MFKKTKAGCEQLTAGADFSKISNSAISPILFRASDEQVDGAEKIFFSTPKWYEAMIKLLINNSKKIRSVFFVNFLSKILEKTPKNKINKLKKIIKKNGILW